MIRNLPQATYWAGKPDRCTEVIMISELGLIPRKVSRVSRFISFELSREKSTAMSEHHGFVIAQCAVKVRSRAPRPPPQSICVGFASSRRQRSESFVFFRRGATLSKVDRALMSETLRRESFKVRSDFAPKRSAYFAPSRSKMNCLRARSCVLRILSQLNLKFIVGMGCSMNSAKLFRGST